MGKILQGGVVAVSASKTHGFSKRNRPVILLIEGLGVEGDAHMGSTTRHRYLIRKDPKRPNLTQVHLIHVELLEELAADGVMLSAGEMGENVTTRGLDLLGMPVGTRLYLGESASVEVTGLRDPCSQLNSLQPGLMKRLIGRGPSGEVIRKAGIMGVVLHGGEVKAGDEIRVELPPEPWIKMGPV